MRLRKSENYFKAFKRLITIQNGKIQACEQLKTNVGFEAINQRN